MKKIILMGRFSNPVTQIGSMDDKADLTQTCIAVNRVRMVRLKSFARTGSRPTLEFNLIVVSHPQLSG